MMFYTLSLLAIEYKSAENVSRFVAQDRLCNYFVVYTSNVEEDWQYLQYINPTNVIKTDGERYIVAYIDKVPYYFNKSFSNVAEMVAFVKYHNKRFCSNPYVNNKNDFAIFDKVAVLVYNYIDDDKAVTLRQLIGAEYQIAVGDIGLLHTYIDDTPEEIPFLLIKKNDQIKPYYLQRKYKKDQIISKIESVIGDCKLKKPEEWSIVWEKIQQEQNKQEL